MNKLIHCKHAVFGREINYLGWNIKIGTAPFLPRTAAGPSKGDLVAG